MKLPYLQFYTGDWLKDPELSICSPATRGVWIDLLCAMHEKDRSGILRGTPEQLARVARCSTVELKSALTELQTTGAADVNEQDGVVIVLNRRMRREYVARQRLALRSWISYRWKRLFDRLARRNGPVCACCGAEDDLQIDHVVPIAKGGDNRFRVVGYFE